MAEEGVRGGPVRRGSRIHAQDPLPLRTGLRHPGHEPVHRAGGGGVPARRAVPTSRAAGNRPRALPRLWEDRKAHAGRLGGMTKELLSPEGPARAVAFETDRNIFPILEADAMPEPTRT